MRRREEKQQEEASEVSDLENRASSRTNKKKKKQIGPPKPKRITARIVSVESSSSYMVVSDEENDHLLTPSSEEPAAVVAAEPMVEVVAPSALAENYQFPATVGNRTFMVQVPKGGVEAGQRFLVPLPREEDYIQPQITVPVGQWRDGFWDLFAHGLFHPTVWNSCCCVTIAAGQTISRLQLTWKGRPTKSVQEATGAFRRLFTLVCSYWVVRALMFFTIANLDPNAKFDGSPPDNTQDEEPPNSYYLFCFLDDILWYGYFAFCVYLLKNIRSQIRSKYSIPESGTCPSGYEDLCTSLVCPCFTAGQMLRHTTDYNEYPSKCCSDTGLPPRAPAIV